MPKKEDTPMREIRRRYEERNKERRKQTNKPFSTYIPTADSEEINTFLKQHCLTKVDLIYEGYRTLKQHFEQQEAKLRNNREDKE